MVPVAERKITKQQRFNGGRESAEVFLFTVARRDKSAVVGRANCNQ